MSEAPVVVSIRDVSKRFVIRKEKSLKERLVNFGRSNRHKEDFYALRDVSLDIEAGSTVGLIGPNGSGKSTLLKAIGGIIQPSTGQVLRRGRLAALLELGAGFHPDLTGRENVFLNASILGLTQKETEGYFDDIVDFAGIGDFIDTQVKFYSSGMYVRLAFAVAVHVDPDILIVDEVLAVGDEPFQRKCMDRIKQFQRAGKTIILVTHSLAQVGELCDRAIVLEQGRVKFDGDADGAIQALRDDFEKARMREIASARTALIQQGLRIESTTLAGPDDDGQLRDETDLVVEVVLRSDAPVDGVVVGTGIETPLGQVVWGSNSELLDVPISIGTEPLVVRYVLGSLHLGHGQYVVHASLGTLATGEISRDPQAGVFTVRRDNRNVGVVDADVALETRSMSDVDQRDRTGDASSARRQLSS